MSQIVARAPAYLASFQCIGPACEDHCCGGWQGVDVDAPTYARYLQVADPVLGPLLRRHVAPNPDPAATPTERALIDVTGEGGCPFLTGERLCTIQGALGEPVLPTTCDTFPRLATLIDGVVDLGARLACPEIARLALFDPVAIEIQEVESDRRLRERGRYWVETPWLDEPEADDPRHHYRSVRAGCLALLRRRDVPLSARLRALGPPLGELSRGSLLHAESVAWAFAEAARNLDRERDGDRASTLGRQAASHPTTDAEGATSTPSNDLLAGRGDDSALVPELILSRVRVWVAMTGVPPRYRRCLDRLRDGLALPRDPSAPLGPRTHEAYAVALRRHVRPYLASRPSLLENALANYVHLSTFPYHPTRTFYEEYAALVSRAASLVLHLAGAAAAEGCLTDELVVETVQAFDKYADSPDYWDRVLALLERHDALGLPSLWALIPEV